MRYPARTVDPVIDLFSGGVVAADLAQKVFSKCYYDLKPRF